MIKKIKALIQVTAGNKIKKSKVIEVKKENTLDLPVKKDYDNRQKNNKR
jgi:hypothetical protein